MSNESKTKPIDKTHNNIKSAKFLNQKYWKGLAQPVNVKNMVQLFCIQ